MKTCILRGVPPCLQQDGWWLGPITAAKPSPKQPRAAQNTRRYALHALLLAVLIGFAFLPETPSTLPPGAHAACVEQSDLGFRAASVLRSVDDMQSNSKSPGQWRMS